MSKIHPHFRRSSPGIVPQATRKAIAARLNRNQTPETVATELNVGLRDVFRVNAWLRHLNARSGAEHKAITEALRAQLAQLEQQASSEEAQKAQRKVAAGKIASMRRDAKKKCVVLHYASGPCSACGVHVAENQHGSGDGSTVAIYCGNCCPSCKEKNERKSK